LPNYSLEPNHLAASALGVGFRVRRAVHARPSGYAALAQETVRLRIRAERARPKSCKDDAIIAQGKGGTSAALGKRHKMIPSLFSNLVWRAERAKPDWKKEKLGLVRSTQGGASAALP
jgi:hypothetical protein